MYRFFLNRLTKKIDIDLQEVVIHSTELYEIIIQ